jgi:hypothetical protein
LEYPKDDTRLNPLQHLLEIRTWGTKWKRVIDKTYEWAAWQWVNAKINKESLALLKQTIHISKENMGDYNLAMFTHAMDYSKNGEYEKSDSKTFFYKLVEQFVERGFGNTWQLVVNRIHETQ